MTSDDRRIWDVFYGILGCPTVIVAHDLGVFPLLAKEPDLPAVCEALGLAPRPARLMMTVLESLGFAGRTGERYRLTPLAEKYLVQESPAYFGGYLDWIRDNYGVWSVDAIRRAIVSNEPQAYAGQDIYATHAEGAEAADRFTRAMHARSMSAASVWPDALDLSGHRVFLDIGGGSGAHCIGVVRRWPNLRAIVFDLEKVCGVAAGFIADQGLSDRISTHPGDFWHDPLPAADLHFFSSVYPDWPEEKCQLLTSISFENLPPGGRIIVHQYLYDDDRSGPFAVAASDMIMLLWTEGEFLSGAELSSMLEKAGFIDLEVKSTFGYFNIVTGRKPS